MRRRHQLVGLVVVVSAAFQAVPTERSNPSDHVDPEIPPGARTVLERACYDCHSNQTRRPWYAHVAPVSWLISHDVTEARAEMNLSRWHQLPIERQRRLAEECLEEASEGKMPPRLYRLLHGDAILSDADLDELALWAGQPGGHVPGEAKGDRDEADGSHAGEDGHSDD